MNEYLEMVELQFPSVFPKGVWVKITKIITAVGRPMHSSMLGKTGIVQGHRTHHNQRWNRISLDDGGICDFVTLELQKME